MLCLFIAIGTHETDSNTDVANTNTTTNTLTVNNINDQYTTM